MTDYHNPQFLIPATCISATVDGFACQLLGKDEVAVYDGSMADWVRDESLPLTTGTEP